jgi:hypothetical protein
MGSRPHLRRTGCCVTFVVLVLLGRRGECVRLDRLLELLSTGESSALVVRGEAGIGKSALLSYLVERAAGCRVARAVGVQSEMELPFAALHQLCAPMLNRLEGVPRPQREALGTAFGLRDGPVPDQFLIGLAVLSLLAEAARKRPLVCVIDDAQWLDRASRLVLAFVARRLGAESVVMGFAVRELTDELAGLPELVVDGLHDDDARALLRSAVRGPLDARVGERIVAEMHGNPLALLELPRGLSPAELAGGFGLPAPLSDRIEQSFRRRLEPLTPAARWLLLVASTEAVGDPVLVWEATRRLGKGVDQAAAAEVTHLVEFGARVRFRHPLVRAAIYQAASPADRQSVHGALADVTDPELDPDRRAWHRAHAAVGPDEGVAAELERSAGRAQARAGLAAAAAFL